MPPKRKVSSPVRSNRVLRSAARSAPRPQPPPSKKSRMASPKSSPKRNPTPKTNLGLSEFKKLVTGVSQNNRYFTYNFIKPHVPNLIKPEFSLKANVRTIPRAHKVEVIKFLLHGIMFLIYRAYEMAVITKQDKKHIDLLTPMIDKFNKTHPNVYKHITNRQWLEMSLEKDYMQKRKYEDTEFILETMDLGQSVPDLRILLKNNKVMVYLRYLRFKNKSVSTKYLVFDLNDNRPLMTQIKTANNDFLQAYLMFYLPVRYSEFYVDKRENESIQFLEYMKKSPTNDNIYREWAYRNKKDFMDVRVIPHMTIKGVKSAIKTITDRQKKGLGKWYKVQDYV